MDLNMYLYHRVPVNLQGNMLFPLNELKQVHDNLYQFHVKKYRDRERALERRVLPLDCLWNDVLHLSPIHPHKLKKALIEQGLQLSNLGRYFRFEALNLGLNECNSTFFWSKEQKFGEWSAKESDYFKFDVARLSEMSDLPPETERYYAQQISIGASPLLYFRTPHVLFKGSINIDESVEIIDC
ncbi:hypothetical protein [Vibrio parahaemolyticus]|uniref:hypothetical protein n=1 Tax=Vibrio parahaemolyticus TaxID=670 RepID=UPI00209AB619|nr:hypothetical protein [Vibrio parahaemolyticus]